MDRKNIQREYSRLLSSHGYGHALYEPVSSEELKPGFCGFFNSDKVWNPLFDLDNHDLLQQWGLSRCNVERGKPTDRTWGPKNSAYIRETEIKLDVEASLMQFGFLADVGAVFQFQASREKGAVLLTSSPVEKCSLKTEAPFKTWVKENARLISTRWPDVLEHGLFIVTSTFATAQALTNMLQSSGQTATAGLKGGGLNTSISWVAAHNESGWVVSLAEKISNSKQVVFTTGLYFRWPWYASLTGKAKFLNQKKFNRQFRSAISESEDGGDTKTDLSPTQSNQAESSSQIELECEAVGEIEHRLFHDGDVTT